MYVNVCLLVSLLNIILLVLVGKISCFEMKHIYGSVEVIQEFKKKIYILILIKVILTKHILNTSLIL